MAKQLIDKNFYFSARCVKAYIDENGNKHVVAIASDTGRDYANERFSEHAIDKMVEAVSDPNREVLLMTHHTDSFGFGVAVEASKTEQKEFFVDFKLKDSYPQSGELFDEVKEKKNQRQLSVGGYLNWENPNAVYFENDDEGMIKVLDDFVLEHVVTTAPGYACNPRTHFIEALAKNVYARTGIDVTKGKSLSTIKKVPSNPSGNKTAELDTSWSFSTSDANMILGDDPGSSEWSIFSKCHAWYDDKTDDDHSPPWKKGAYKLPHHKEIDGEILCVWRGVAAAMGALLGARGGVNIPDNEKRAVYNHLKAHYKQFDKDVPEFKSYTFEEFVKFHEKQGMRIKDLGFVRDVDDDIIERYFSDNNVADDVDIGKTQFIQFMLVSVWADSDVVSYEEALRFMQNHGLNTVDVVISDYGAWQRFMFNQVDPAEFIFFDIFGSGAYSPYMFLIGMKYSSGETDIVALDFEFEYNVKKFLEAIMEKEINVGSDDSISAIAEKAARKSLKELLKGLFKNNDDEVSIVELFERAKNKVASSDVVVNDVLASTEGMLISILPDGEHDKVKEFFKTINSDDVEVKTDDDVEVKTDDDVEVKTDDDVEVKTDDDVEVKTDDEEQFDIIKNSILENVEIKISEAIESFTQNNLKLIIEESLKAYFGEQEFKDLMIQILQEEFTKLSDEIDPLKSRINELEVKGGKTKQIQAQEVSEDDDKAKKSKAVFAGAFIPGNVTGD